ncbi:hypothetical protein [Hathewaya limosa]|uniref:Cell division protein FtsL n=1 Tax=Hathewaya limosa TaxID=1536 RepID=A0ABU0JUV2_HATLI|nr:hypothetical protein [Hathewaya limosa]MDQ0480883.1 hypothetical protein [Hathewaya limosa]
MIVSEKENIYMDKMVVNGTPIQKEKKKNKKSKIYKELSNFKKENHKNINDKKKNKKITMMKSVIAIFLVGMVIMVRYSIIYANQKSISNIKTEISKTKYKNDDLRIYLMKFKDIKNVDDVARNKFKMVEPSVNNTYYYDLGKDNFEDNKNVNKSVSNLIEKIKNILF